MTVPRFFMTEIRPGIVNATTTMMAVVMQRLRYVATSLASDANSIRTRKYRHTAIAIGAAGRTSHKAHPPFTKYVFLWARGVFVPTSHDLIISALHNIATGSHSLICKRIAAKQKSRTSKTDVRPKIRKT